MRVVQMTLDEKLVETVDRAARKLRMSRSAFTREALKAALQRQLERERERQQRSGYAKHPVRKDEFKGWAREQVWPA